MTLLRKILPTTKPRLSGTDESAQLQLHSFPLSDPGNFALDAEGNVWVLNSSRGDGYCQGGIRYNTQLGDWDDFFHIVVEDTNSRHLSGIAFENGHVWVWDLSQEELWGYDPRTRGAPFLAHSLSIAASSEIRTMISGGGYVWLGLSAGGTGGTSNVLLRFDVSDPSSVGATPTADFGDGAQGIFGMAYDASNSLVWSAATPAGLYYQDATNLATPATFLALTNLTQPRGVTVAEGFVWLLGESSANSNVWMWKVNAATQTEVTSYDLDFVSNSAWVEAHYDPRNRFLWVNDNNVPAMAAYNIDTGAAERASINTSATIRRALLSQGVIWTCHNAAGDPANSIVQKHDIAMITSETFDGTSPFNFMKASRGYVVDTDTPDGSMLPDDVDLVIVDLPEGDTRTIYLPPIVENPESLQSPDVNFLRIRGKTVTFVDVGGTLGQEETAVRIVSPRTGSSPGQILHGVQSAISAEPGVYWFHQAYGSVTFRFDSRAADTGAGYSNPATYGKWFCVNDSRPWVDQVITTGSTIPLGRVRCLMETTGTLYLQNPQGDGSEAYWGSECIIKTGPSVVTIKIDAGDNDTDVEGADDYWIDHPNGWVHLAYMGGTGWTIVGSGPYNEDRAMQDDLTATPTYDFAPVDSGGAVPWSRATILVLGAPTSDRTLGGITGLSSGVQRKKLINQGPNNIILTHEDGSNPGSTNRFHTSTGATVTVAADEMVDIVYDEQISRWRVNG